MLGSVLLKISFLIALAFFYEWILRKTKARIQRRYGPLYTGKFGLLQPFADFLKLLFKEDVSNKFVDRPVFESIPLLSFVSMLFALFFVSLPGPTLSFGGDLFLVFSLLTLQVFFLAAGAQTSGSRFSFVGAKRNILLLIGFDIPLFLVSIGPGIISDSLSISVISKTPHYQILGFGVFIVCALAQLELLPFDIPKAKQEIVAGIKTEYSGKKLALLRLGNDLEFVLLSFLGTNLFLGSSFSILKATGFAFAISVLSALFGRFRIDQAVKKSWKFLIPGAALQLIGVILLA